MSEVTIATMTARWSGLERPLFKGKLIDNDGCKCAQGDVLFCAGYTDEQLRKMKQSKADTETARVLGISRTHAVLLRQVNDKVDGAPQLVLTNPEQIHSAIGFVTPAQRHAGLDRALLEERALVYERARQENPQHWSGQARQWAHVDTVHLNPDTEQQTKEPEHTQKAA